EGKVPETHLLTYQADLGKDVFVRVDARGRVLGIWFDPTQEKLAVNSVRTLLAAMQFVLPEKTADLGRWEVREEDANRSYLACYEAQPGQGTADPDAPRTFRKTRKETPEPARKKRRGDTRAHPRTQATGRMTARFDVAGGRLLSWDGSE